MHTHEDPSKFHKNIGAFDKILTQGKTWHFKTLVMFPGLDKIPIITSFIKSRYLKNLKEMARLGIEQIEECKKTYNLNDELQTCVHTTLEEIQTHNSLYNCFTDEHTEGMNEDHWFKSPFPLPWIGNMLSFDFLKVHHWIYDARKKYGPVFTIWFPSPVVVFADYDTIAEALITKGEDFAGRNLNFPDAMFHEDKEIGVIFTEGKVWRDQRRLAIHFLRDLGMGKNLMEEKISLVLDDTIKYIDNLSDTENVDIGSIIHLTVGNVITMLLFGYTHRHDDPSKFYQFVDALEKFMTQGTKWHFRVLIMFPGLDKVPIIGSFIKSQYFKNSKEMARLSNEQIEECKKTYNFNDEPQNFVHAALKEIQTDNSPYSYLTDRHIEGMVEDFWFAGMETSASTLKWLLLFAMKYPDYQRRIQEEIDSVVGKDGEISMKYKNDLPLLSAFIIEGQRCANIFAFSLNHKCTKDNYIGGYLIREGTIVSPYSYAINLDEKMYNDPRTFNPERYLEDDGKTLNKSLIEKGLIFGTGKRQCAGESLAKMEIFMIFGTLLQKYTLTHDHAFIDIEPQFCGLLLPKKYHCKIEKRM